MSPDTAGHTFQAALCGTLIRAGDPDYAPARRRADTRRPERLPSG